MYNTIGLIYIYAGLRPYELICHVTKIWKIISTLINNDIHIQLWDEAEWNGDRDVFQDDFHHPSSPDTVLFLPYQGCSWKTSLSRSMPRIIQAVINKNQILSHFFLHVLNIHLRKHDFIVLLFILWSWKNSKLSSIHINICRRSFGEVWAFLAPPLGFKVKECV